jgi:hypothetical protein
MLAPAVILAFLARGHTTLAKFNPHLVRHIRETAELPNWNAIDYDNIDNDDNGAITANGGCKSAAWLLQLYFPNYQTAELPTLVYKSNVVCGEATRAVGCAVPDVGNFFEDNDLGLLTGDHERGVLVVKSGQTAEYEFHICLHELIHLLGFLANLQPILEIYQAAGSLFAKTLCHLWKLEHGGAAQQPKSNGHWSIDQNNDNPAQQTGSHIYWNDQAEGRDESRSQHELMTSVVSTELSEGGEVDDVTSYLSASTLYAIQSINALQFDLDQDIDGNNFNRLYPPALRDPTVNNDDIKRRWCFPISDTDVGSDTEAFACGVNQRCVSVTSLGQDGTNQDKRPTGTHDITWNDIPGVCVYDTDDGTDGQVITVGDAPGGRVYGDAEDCNYAPLATSDAGNDDGGGGGGFIIVSSASMPEQPSLFWTVLLASSATALIVASII